MGHRRMGQQARGQSGRVDKAGAWTKQARGQSEGMDKANAWINRRMGEQALGQSRCKHKTVA